MLCRLSVEAIGKWRWHFFYVPFSSQFMHQGRLAPAVQGLTVCTLELPMPHLIDFITFVMLCMRLRPSCFPDVKGYPGAEFAAGGGLPLFISLSYRTD